MEQGQNPEARSDSASSLSITGSTLVVAQQQQSGRHWSITINNPTEEDKMAWTNVQQHHFVEGSLGQLEQGENGTVHIQGYLKTQKVRFSAIKKIFPRAHIEIAKNPNALARYVVKEETRLAPLPTGRTATPQLVQAYVLTEVINMLGNRRYFRKLNKEERQMEWCSEELPPAEFSEGRLGNIQRINMNRMYIDKHALQIVDTAVSQMIEQGIYGVEFVMSNNQVRSAYKNYLPSILIRTITDGSQDNTA